MTGQIAGLITGEVPSPNKLKNLSDLKSALTESKRQGGKNIIVVDEDQRLGLKRQTRHFILHERERRKFLLRHIRKER